MPKATPVKAKSTRKNAASTKRIDVTLGNRRRAGVTLGRSGRVRGQALAEVDQFGLLTDSKYRDLGPRCRRNVAIAESEGFVFLRTSGTTEEQVIYGELRRRGFGTPLGNGPRSFTPQSPIAGSIVDFEILDGGEKVALRPMNEYWHGTSTGRREGDAKGEEIVARGYTLYDIWSGDVLDDLRLKSRMDTFFGEG